MDIFVLTSVGILAAMTGFWLGRSLTWQLAEAEGDLVEGSAAGREIPSNENVSDVWFLKGSFSNGESGLQENGFADEGALNSRGEVRMANAGAAHGGNGIREGRNLSGAKRRKNVVTLSPGREIASPVTGQVSLFEEEGRRRFRILPDQGKVYAPASGRIRRLYPMGSAMLLQTEFGAEILLQAGRHVNEMCSGYYRCRVMEHEYVRKGTLLLEYDPAAVRREGAEPELILSVENETEFSRTIVCARPRMKTGEPLVYVEGGRQPQAYEQRI